MTRSFLLAALLALSACAESDDAALVPIEEEAGLIGTLGEWALATQDERPVLQFGPAGTQPLFSLRCDDRQGLLLQRHGVVPAGAAEMMTVTLGAATRRLAVNPVAAAVPLLRAAVPANDDLIAELADATVPIMIAVSDDPVLNLPPSPLVGEYVGSCTEPRQAPPAVPDVGNAAAPAQ